MIRQWDDLRFFLATARGGTFAAAAAGLDVDPSTVFRRIRGLERELGARLLERRGRGAVLTAHGEALVEYAARIEEELFAIDREIAGRERELRGRVRLTTTDSVAEHLLGPPLRAFRDAYPGIAIDLIVDNRFFRLDRGEADVALRPGPRPTEGEVIARRLSGVATALYASQGYLERAGRPRRPADLRRHDVVTVDESLAHLALARRLKELCDPDRIACRVTTIPALVAAVRGGLGISALPCFLADRSAELVRLFAVEPDLETGLWLLWHRDLRRSARVRTLTAFLETALAAERPLLEGKTSTPRGGRKLQPV